MPTALEEAIADRGRAINARASAGSDYVALTNGECSWNRISSALLSEKTPIIRKRLEALRAYRAAADAEHAAYQRVEQLQPSPFPHVPSPPPFRTWHPYPLDMDAELEGQKMLLELAALEFPDVPVKQTASMAAEMVRLDLEKQTKLRPIPG